MRIDTKPDWKQDYDWQRAFEVGNERLREGVLECGTAAVCIDDVVEVLASREGANDEESWLMAGRLEDDRYFFLSAWCDYTGWG